MPTALAGPTSQRDPPALRLRRGRGARRRRIAVTVVDRARSWFAQAAGLSPYSPVRSETAE